MPRHPQSDPKNGGVARRRRRLQRGLSVETQLAFPENPAAEIDVGRRLRELRTESGFSLRALAELSSLNVNTLSLIENGKTSPSVSTLQQLAGALGVPIAAFFVPQVTKSSTAFLKVDQRQRVAFSRGTLEDLGGGLTLGGGQPFVVNLEPNADSGSTPIVHTGHEFVFCRLQYTVEDQVFLLDPGDSLLFEAHLPHRWQNVGETPSRSLLLLCPADEADHPTEMHFIPE
jgi:transcriptional regulator with XRE-family HTH domain